MRVAIFGASGLVGSRLFERWFESGRFEPVPIVHSTGNAWRIIRTGRAVRMCDLLDLRSVREALKGCDAVVNATRGSNEVMLSGLRNLLAESRAAGVSRFVHLSSVLVYGDPPPQESRTEDCVAAPVAGTYGAIKAMQDRLVSRAADDGLSSAILCPPNIGGPGSYFLLGLARALADGSLVLLDGASGPCALVDVDNLCDAIELALQKERVSSGRMFVTDSSILTWAEIVQMIADRLRIQVPDERISREVVEREWCVRNVPSARPSLRATLRYIGSSRVRGLLREDPLLGAVEGAAKRFIRKVRPSVEDVLLQATDGSAEIVSYDPLDGLARPYLYPQLRSVYHSPDLARKVIGYSPRISSAESIVLFCQWFLDMSGWSDADFGDLARMASDISLKGLIAGSKENARVEQP